MTNFCLEVASSDRLLFIVVLFVGDVENSEYYFLNCKLIIVIHNTHLIVI